MEPASLMSDKVIEGEYEDSRIGLKIKIGCPDVVNQFIYKEWLGDKDLNLDSRSQSPLSCR
jgi:hypothetical protein